MAKCGREITWAEYKSEVERLGVRENDKICFISFDAEDFNDCKLEVIRNSDDSVQITLEEE